MHRWFPLRAVLAAIVLAAASVLVHPAQALAQLVCPESGCPDETAPQVIITPYGGAYTSTTLPVQIAVSDSALDEASLRVSWNGRNVSTLSYSRTSSSPIAGVATGQLTLALGTNTLSAQICDTSNNCTTETATYDLAASTVRVTPDGGVVQVYGGAVAPFTFYVRNTGGVTATYALEASCRDGRSGDPVAGCSAPSAPLTLAPGDSAAVAVNVTGTTPGVLLLARLSASSQADSALSDAGWVDVEVRSVPGQAAGAMEVSVGDANAGAQIDRSQCLTVSVGDGAAMECGDLRLVHGLPAIATRGKARSPTLIYNSDHAHPRPIVYADVRLPTGRGVPTEVRATLTVNGLPAQTRTWAGSYWSGGTSRRIGVQVDALSLVTGVYGYSLEVTAVYGTAQYPVVHTGELAVVNRKDSPFGPGWWLAGHEQLVYVNYRWLGVAGDGSTRIYEWRDNGVWVAPGVSRPDSLLGYTVNSGASYYRRPLPGGTVVWFDDNLRHVATINRLADHTWFRYNAAGRLDSLQVPRRDGVSTAFRFAYAGAPERVSSVTLTSAGTVLQTSVLEHTAGRLTAVTDPDQVPTRFLYTDAGTPNRVTGRTGRGGTTVNYAFGTGGKLITVFQPLNATETAVTGFEPGESKGITAPVPSGAGTYTRLDGPRGVETGADGVARDVRDITFVWINKWGAPTRIRDPLGSETRLFREHAAFPALVTAMTAPNGLRSTMHYNPRGLPDSARVINPLGDGRNAVSHFEYDAVWTAFASRIVTPGGLVTTMGYDPATGNRIWQQAGNDPARRVQFGYHSSGPGEGMLASITTPATAGNPPATEQLLYDGAGNPNGSISPLGAQVTVLNDALGRPVRVHTPVTGALVRVDTTEYDIMGRVTKTQTIGPPMSGTGEQRVIVVNGYNLAGQLTSVSRSSAPDILTIGAVTTGFEYDFAGRKVREIAPDGAADSTFYDRAGNAVRVRTRRFWGAASADPYVSMRYDAAGRLVERRTPSLVNPAYEEGEAKGSYRFSYGITYPAVTVAADTARYAYDGSGNMLRADNHDAWIRRSYYPNGALHGDTLVTRTLAELSAGGDRTSHIYGLEHRYDLEGRRIELKHPDQLAPRSYGVLKDRTRFGYDPAIGALSVVEDPLGEQFRYHYDMSGQQDSLYYPGGLIERFGYDRDGRLTRNDLFNSARFVLLNPYPDAWLRQEDRVYNTGGMMTWSGDASGNRDTVNVAYTGLGQMAYSTHVYRGQQIYLEQPARFEEGEFPTHDALGNIASMYRSGANQVFARTWFDAASASSSSSNTVWTYQPGTGRLLRRLTASGRDTTLYNAGGDIVFTHQSATTGATAFDRASYYGADGTLRQVVSRRIEQYGARTAPLYVVRERYRYDALGRRVLVHTAKSCENPASLYPGGSTMPCSVGSLRRTVWDGNSELYDIQVPVGSLIPSAGASFTVAEMENDTAWVRDLGVWDGFDPHPMYGRVAYTYGHAIDRPLSIVRMGYSDRNTGQPLLRWTEPFSIAPHWNTRGVAQSGTISNGNKNLCQTFNGESRCVYIDWQAGWYPYNPVRVIPEFWHGTLLTEKRDGSGLLYRRNRYYDPSSSRFTQEDPIGLAGGLNAYGFAEGDPVSHSDPYGLCPPAPCDDSPENSPEGLQAQARAIVRVWNALNNSFVCPASPEGLTCKGGTADFGLVGGVGPARSLGGAANIANGARLSSALRFAEGASVFTRSGRLQGSVISRSSEIIRGSQLNNPAVIRELTRDGSNIADWGKYTTPSFRGPSGDFQVHFYRNRATGQVNYNIDYKVVFNQSR